MNKALIITVRMNAVHSIQNGLVSSLVSCFVKESSVSAFAQETVRGMYAILHIAGETVRGMYAICTLLERLSGEGTPSAYGWRDCRGKARHLPMAGETVGGRHAHIKHSL